MPGRGGRAGGAVASTTRVRGAAGAGRVCVGAVSGAHGVRGAVRIRSFTAEPAGVAAYGPVSDESGERVFDVRVRSVRDGTAIADLSGVDGRDAADALRGERLYVPRAVLPPPGDGEFYHADLLGLSAERADGSALGTVVAVIPAGDGSVLEIDPGDGRAAVLVPFTARAVPEVDVAAGRAVVEPPPSGGDGRGDGGGDGGQAHV